MLLSTACLYQAATIGVMYSPTAVDIVSGGGLYQLFADVSQYPTADGYGLFCSVRGVTAGDRYTQRHVSRLPQLSPTARCRCSNLLLPAWSVDDRVRYTLKVVAVVNATTVEASQIVRVDNSGGTHSCGKRRSDCLCWPRRCCCFSSRFVTLLPVVHTFVA